MTNMTLIMATTNTWTLAVDDLRNCDIFIIFGQVSN